MTTYYAVSKKKTQGHPIGTIFKVWRGMTERIVVGQDGRKHITTEPKLHTTPDDTALLRQALKALETPVQAQPFGLKQVTIAALRERLGETK